jgi:23S rRNA pseudouridine2605 synthase
MRKSSSSGPRDNKSGSKNTFKKDDGRKPYGKDSKPFKKNYDGRGPSSGGSGEGGASRSARPYSGRVTDGDKPSFGKGGRGDAARKPRKEFDSPRSDERKPFGDRKPRSFDKPGGGDDRKPFGDRKPRSFDRPGGGEDRKPFGERKPRSFDKPARDDDRKPLGERKPRSFDKPAFNKDGDDRKPFGDRKPRSFDKSDRSDDRKPRRDFDKPGRPDDKKPYGDRKPRSFDKPSFKKEGDDRKPRKDFDKPKSSGDTRPFREREKPFAGKAKQEEDQPTFGDVMNNAFKQGKKKKPDVENGIIAKPTLHEDQVFGALEEPVAEERPKRPFDARKKVNGAFKKHIHDHSGGRKKKYIEDEEDEDDKEISQKDGPRLEMPLNKFIAHSGECSRRDAAELVKQGKVKVNGELVLDPGYRVQHDDKVTMSGKKLIPQKNMVYILLNKPKGFITTNDDPQGRKTVMELVGNSGVDRLFPVGRLDRDTSGLLLITNDGELTQKLCHPAYNIKKVYQVTLDKPLTKADFEKIIEGVELEDGKAVVDALSYLEKKNELGLEIHSGRNRIVRRIFEALGYVVDKLDRVMYAGLTKKNLPRSKWRYLDEREVVLLKHFKN